MAGRREVLQVVDEALLAEKTFNRLVDEFPESPFTVEARRELDQMKKT